MKRRKTFREVPCDGCTLCCQGDAVRLEPEELLMNFSTEPHPALPGARMIAHKPNGDCIYLDDHGCSIHDHAPALCRIADCRGPAARLDFATARTMHLQGKLDFRVWDRGRRLLEQLSHDHTKQQREEET
jgi:hypothetical protein